MTATEDGVASALTKMVIKPTPLIVQVMVEVRPPQPMAKAKVVVMETKMTLLRVLQKVPLKWLLTPRI